MSWQGALILACLFMAVFALGCWYGQRERRRYGWDRTYDPRDQQSGFNRIWRIR
jgi:hypothetical protein